MNNPYNAPTADMSTVGNIGETYQPKVFSMSGRIGRVRYLAYSMAISIALLVALAAVAGVAAAVTGGSQGVMLVLGLLFYIPMFAVGFIMAIRRVHDMGHSGWLSLLILVPIANLWLLFAPGTAGANEYGPAPVKNTTGVIVAAFLPFILMVVIGIVAAIAMPAYMGAMSKAQGVTEIPALPVEGEASQ